MKQMLSNKRHGQVLTCVAIALLCVSSAYGNNSPEDLATQTNPKTIYPSDPLAPRICIDQLFVPNEAIITSNQPAAAKQTLQQAISDTLSWSNINFLTECKQDTIDNIPFIEQADYYLTPVLTSWIEQPNWQDIKIKAATHIGLWKVRDKKAYLINTLQIETPTIADNFGFWLEDLFPSNVDDPNHTSESNDEAGTNTLDKYRREQMAYQIASKIASWLQQHYQLQPRELVRINEENPDKLESTTATPLPWFVDDWIALYRSDLQYQVALQRVEKTQVVEMVTIPPSQEDSTEPQPTASPANHSDTLYNVSLAKPMHLSDADQLIAKRIEKIGFEFGLAATLEPFLLKEGIKLITNHRIPGNPIGLPAIKAALALNLFRLNLGDLLLSLQGSYAFADPLQYATWAAGIEKRWWLHQFGVQAGLKYAGARLAIPTFSNLIDSKANSNTIVYAHTIQHGIQGTLALLWAIAPSFLFEFGGGYRYFPQAIASFTGKDQDVSLGESNGITRAIRINGWMAHLQCNWLF